MREERRDAHRNPESERDKDREEDDDKMRLTEKMKGRFGIHDAVDASLCEARQTTRARPVRATRRPTPPEGGVYS